MSPLILTLVYLAWATWTIFIVAYWLLARWWESDIGRNVMGVALVVWGLLALIAAQQTWPDYALRTLAQALIYGGAVVFGAQRTVQMVREQLHKRKARR